MSACSRSLHAAGNVDGGWLLPGPSPVRQAAFPAIGDEIGKKQMTGGVREQWGKLTDDDPT